MIRGTAEKFEKGVTSMIRLMSNVVGSKSRKRLLQITKSLICTAQKCGRMYWVRKCTGSVCLVQRREPLRVIFTEAAVLVIAGFIRIDLLTKERRAIYPRKSEVDKERSIRRRHRAWDEETTGY